MSQKRSLQLADVASEYVFPASMALFMVYGMELYNHVLMSGSFTAQTLLSPLAELIPMAIAVLVVEHVLGGRIVAALLSRVGDPKKLRIPYGVLVGTITCVVMCPLMSMVATLVFKHPSPSTLVPLWFSTFTCNLPFALAWALLVARPASGAIAKRLGAGREG